jgi:hypothetical protein
MAYALAVNSNYEFTEMGTDLAEMQAMVGGLIQPIDLNENLTMWVNEEFIFMPHLELNPLASAYFNVMVGGEYPIHGNVVFTGGCDEEGNLVDLSSLDASQIKLTASMAFGEWKA